jgi:Prokaryotic E2 family D
MHGYDATRMSEMKALFVAAGLDIRTGVVLAPFENVNVYPLIAKILGLQIPREKSASGIESWERSFFQSEFTHASGMRRHTRFPGGLLAMWQFLEGKENFPSRYLVKLRQTLSEFVNDNDHTYRNEVQPRA